MKRKWFPGPGDRWSYMEVSDDETPTKCLALIEIQRLVAWDETRDEPGTDRLKMIGTFSTLDEAKRVCEKYEYQV